MVTCARIGTVVLTGVALVSVNVGNVSAAPGVLKGAGKSNPDHETVEFFAAIEEGRLEAKVIPRDSTRCSLLVKNISDKPVNVAMPDVLAAVPVLAQFANDRFANDGLADNPFPNNRPGNAANSGAPQQLGIGNRFGNPNMMNDNPGQFNMRMPGRGNDRNAFAPFNVAPEKTARLTLPAVCLEHGKRNPKSSMAYTVKPIDEVTYRAEAHEICRMLANGEVDQQVAQAAAWHIANDLDWETLSAKRIRILGYGYKRYFTSQQLSLAKEAVDRSYEIAANRKGPALAEARAARR